MIYVVFFFMINSFGTVSALSSANLFALDANVDRFRGVFWKAARIGTVARLLYV